MAKKKKRTKPKKKLSTILKHAAQDTVDGVFYIGAPIASLWFINEGRPGSSTATSHIVRRIKGDKTAKPLEATKEGITEGIKRPEFWVLSTAVPIGYGIVKAVTKKIKSSVR